jgi:SAM-dependent methyltransferase
VSTTTFESGSRQPAGAGAVAAGGAAAAGDGGGDGGGVDEAARTFLLGTAFGFTAAQVILVTARLGIADLLAGGPMTAGELAAATRTDEPSLRRLLRGLTHMAVVAAVDADRFELAPRGRPLRSGVPGSVQPLIRLFAGDRTWQAWGALHSSLSTGEPYVGGDALRGQDAGEASLHNFNEVMSGGTRLAAAAIATLYDFCRFGTVVDLGGRDGTLLAAILAAAPAARGVVFDLPEGVEEAPARLAREGVAERCEVVAGDFLVAVPPGDCIVAKNILHNWHDDEAATILRNCRAAVPADGRLLIVEPVLPDVVVPGDPVLGPVLAGDLNLLVATGGLERTRREYERLLEGSGWRPLGVTPFPRPSGLSLVEAAPA